MTLYGLFSQTNWFIYDVLNGIPLGNLFIVASLFGFGLIALICAPRERLFQGIGRFTFLLSISWYPLGIFLSGNTRLNFNNNATWEYWLYFSAGIAMFCFVVALSFVFFYFFNKKNKTKKVFAD